MVSLLNEVAASKDLWVYAFAVFFTIWVIAACAHLYKSYRRAWATDGLTYSDGAPPSLRRSIYACCLLVFGATLGQLTTLEEFFVWHRRRQPLLAQGRIHALSVHGVTVYLTQLEHALVSDVWFLLMALCFLTAIAIRQEGDPFGSRLGDTPLEALPRSMLPQGVPKGLPPTLWLLLMIAGSASTMAIVTLVLNS